MAWTCRDCPKGVVCGNPPPTCPQDLPLEELAEKGWVKAGCYCIVILHNAKTGDIWLRQAEPRECGEVQTY